MKIVMDYSDSRDPSSVLVDSFVLRHTDLDDFARKLVEMLPRAERVRIYVGVHPGDPIVDTREPPPAEAI